MTKSTITTTSERRSNNGQRREKPRTKTVRTVLVQNSKKKNKKGSRAKNRQLTSGGIGTLGACAQAFAYACSNGFDPRAEGACIPTLPARDSYKMAPSVVGTMHVGTGGYGYVAILPCLAGDSPSLYVSTAAKASINLDITATTIAAFEYTPLYNTSAYAATSFQDGTDSAPATHRGRVVGATVKVTYIDSTSTMQGTVTKITSSDHTNLNNQSPNNLLSMDSASTRRVTPDPTVMSVYPTIQEEFNYRSGPTSTDITSNIYPLQGALDNCKLDSGVFAGPAIAVIMVVAAAGQKFLVEYIEHVELVGTGLRSLQKPNFPDVDGFNRVQAGLAQVDSIDRSLTATSKAPSIVGVLDSAMKYASNAAKSHPDVFNMNNLMSAVSAATGAGLSRSLRGQLMVQN